MTAHGFNHCPLSKYIPGPKHNRRKKKKKVQIFKEMLNKKNMVSQNTYLRFVR